jgi:hypothetical protein
MNASNHKRSPVGEKHLHHAGQSLDEEIEIIQAIRICNFCLFLTVLSVVIYEVSHIYYNLPANPLYTIFILCCFGIYVVYKERKLNEEVRIKKQGSDGEKEVAEILDNLKKQGCMVIHDIIFREKHFNIDHVIISRQGIYAIETKTISKPRKIALKDGEYEITSNGDMVFFLGKNTGGQHIHQAKSEAHCLSQYISDDIKRKIIVRPVLVYPGWFVKDYTDSKIWVLNPKIVQCKIEREKFILSDSDCNDIAKSLLRIAL